MTFGHTIMMWCSRWHEFVKLFHIVLIEDQTRNSNICLRDQIVETFSFLVTMIFHFTLKFFELFKCFRLMFRQVDIPISAQIMCEGKKILIPAASINTHRTTYISMYDFHKSVARSIVPENGVLVILPKRHGSQASNDS